MQYFLLGDSFLPGTVQTCAESVRNLGVMGDKVGWRRDKFRHTKSSCIYKLDNKLNIRSVSVSKYKSPKNEMSLTLNSCILKINVHLKSERKKY